MWGWGGGGGWGGVSEGALVDFFVAFSRFSDTKLGKEVYFT